MGCIGLRQFGQNLSRAWLGGILSIVVVVAQAAPLNDNLTNATVLTGVTNFVTSFNFGATMEPGEPIHASVEGGKSIWWSWQSPFTGSASISTAGSSFDTLLAVYTGNAISNLQLVAANDDEGGFGVITSSLVFRAYAGETYRIAVDGFGGASGTVRLAVGRAGYPAPAWQLANLNDQVVTSSDFRNQVLVIDFWKTTCGGCVAELSDLIHLYQNLSPEGLAFIGVSEDPTTSNVRYYAETHQIPYDIAMITGAMQDVFGGGVALPTKFIIDRDNMVVRTYTGAGDYAFYQNMLRPLLRGSTQLPLRPRRQAAGLILAWPATEFGYHAEASTSLHGTNWTTVPYPVVTTNDENTVTVPLSSGNQFYSAAQNDQRSVNADREICAARFRRRPIIRGTQGATIARVARAAVGVGVVGSAALRAAGA